MLLSEPIKGKSELETERETQKERKSDSFTSKVVQCQCRKLGMWKEKAVSRNGEARDDFSNGGDERRYRKPAVE